MLLIGVDVKMSFVMTQLSFPSSIALKPGVAELQLEEEMHPMMMMMMMIFQR
jgi:hypothetical protein